jgi:hypothetical protein
MTFDTFKVGKKMKTAVPIAKKIDKTSLKPCSSAKIGWQKDWD